MWESNEGKDCVILFSLLFWMCIMVAWHYDYRPNSNIWLCLNTNEEEILSLACDCMNHIQVDYLSCNSMRSSLRVMTSCHTQAVVISPPWCQSFRVYWINTLWPDAITPDLKQCSRALERLLHHMVLSGTKVACGVTVWLADVMGHCCDTREKVILRSGLWGAYASSVLCVSWSSGAGFPLCFKNRVW